MDTPSFCKISSNPSTGQITPVHRSSPAVPPPPTKTSSSSMLAQNIPINKMIQQQQLSPPDQPSSLSAKEPSFLRIAVLLLALGQLVLLAALLAALGFLFHLVMNKTTLVSTITPTSFDGQQHHLLPSTILGGDKGQASGGSGFVDLSSLSSVPIEELQSMHALVMKWPHQEDGLGGGREYLFHVLSAVRNNKVTTLHLSADSQLVTDKDRAILLDSQGEEVGRVEFSPPATTTPSPSVVTTSSYRRLGRLMARLADQGVGRYPNNAELGNPQSEFDARCRYGCGKVAGKHTTTSDR
eukprot:GHVS01010355.1.p1 GENE.GHVS01010355.1~~GHVS01010355.1.p1  ORF type:complete len:297 (+),score=70.92 GHVS01010355.1:214-1104(+)